MSARVAAPSPAAIPSAPALVEPRGTGRWSVDPTLSSIRFSVDLPVAPAVTGRFTGVEGLIDLPGAGARSTILVIDGSSLQTTTSRRRSCLTGPNLLDIRNHRWATLVFEHIQPDRGSWHASGHLQVKGQPAAVTARFSFDPATPKFHGALTVDRGAIGLGWAQTPGTTRVALGRDIRLALELTVASRGGALDETGNASASR